MQVARVTTLSFALLCQGADVGLIHHPQSPSSVSLVRTESEVVGRGSSCHLSFGAEQRYPFSVLLA